MVCKVPNFRLSRVAAGICLTALPTIALAQDQSISSGLGFDISISDTPALQGVRTSGPAFSYPAPEFQVTFDGLSAERRLDLVLLNETAVSAGQTVRVQSQMNYPAFVTRGEVRVIDFAATGGARTLAVVPISPNGTAQFTLPEGDAIGILHRVYDAQGRYDETAPKAIGTGGEATFVDAEGGAAIEEGTTTLARVRIPITGGAVTVRGQDLRPGAQVRTLSETTKADGSGAFVLQRILPPGDHPVSVQAASGGGYVERNVTIPKSDWFYTATVDLTFGRRLGDARDASGAALEKDYAYGRLAGFATGRTANGWTITARADTGEEDLEDLFRDFDKKDSYNALRRAAAEDAYPTFGDDSTLEDAAPSDGKFYLKAQKGNSHLLWGNYKATIDGSTYLRNERTLYGAQGVYNSPAQTTRGQARTSVEAYAASPERLPGRENFRGTGGSVYFLQRQDITRGSETLTIEYRDPITGQVYDRQTLSDGRDYVINYTQGIITLSDPLSGSQSDGNVIEDPRASAQAYLVAQYEYTPTAGDIDGYAYGARFEGWVTDNLRIGVTGQVERTDIADQTAQGADLRYEISENSHVALEYAQTEGPGFGSSTSSNGGLIITSTGTAGAEDLRGAAYHFDTRLALKDLGMAQEGYLSAYFDKRQAGFSTLDYQVATDEELWGLSLELQTGAENTVALSYDDYRNADGKLLREGTIDYTHALGGGRSLAFGLAHLDRTEPGGDPEDNGSRTDIGLRYTHEVSDALTWHVFGQATVARSGGLTRNDRVGAGVEAQLNARWGVAASVSDGSQGFGADARVTYENPDRSTTYLGYRLEPGRELSGATLNGRDRGTWVLGGQRRVTDRVDVLAENTYDIFGQRKSLTSVYGVEYRPTDVLSLSGALEVGQVRDGADDFDRTAISLGLRYADEDRIKGTAKLEYRLDDGVIDGRITDEESIYFNAGVEYKIDDENRLVFALDYADTETDNSSVESGTYIDATLGYARRPILDDRFNVLFQYRYLYDMIGQEIDGTSERGPRQESHVLSLDMIYDLDENWTIGGKIGGRWSESAQTEDDAFATNNAWLATASAQYHIPHKWDLLLEARYLEAQQAEFAETGFLAAAYRHVGDNFKLGVGYNFGSFSDDLTDLTYDDEGVFLNLIGKF